MNQIQDEEIDLFELFQTLWDGKWLISAFVALATLIGFGYSHVVHQPKYHVSASYKHNIYPLNGHFVCGRNLGCLKKNATRRLLFLLESGWSEKKGSLSLMATTPLDVSEYEAQLERANVALTNQLYLDAKSDLTLIQKEMSEALVTDNISRYKLIALKIIQSVDKLESAFTFDPVLVVHSSYKVTKILFLSVVLGGMGGVLFIFVRNAIKKRKERLAKA